MGYERNATPCHIDKPQRLHHAKLPTSHSLQLLQCNQSSLGKIKVFLTIMQAYKASPLAHSHNVLGPRQPRLGQRLIQRFRIQSCLPSVQGGVTTIAVLTIYKGQKVQEENFRRSDCCPSVFSPGISPSVPTQKQQPKENLGKVRLKYFFVLW